MTTTVVGVVRVIGGGTSDAAREISFTVTGLALAAGAAPAAGVVLVDTGSIPGMVAGIAVATGPETVAATLG